MRKAEILIVAGVILVPLALCVMFTVGALGETGNSASYDWRIAFLWLAAAIASGLITSGILLRRNR
jgi:hypothetical protein